MQTRSLPRTARSAHSLTAWLPLLIIGALAALLAFAVFTTATGCATTPEGLAREQRICSTASNVVATLQLAAPVLPPPVQVPVEALLAAIAAGLTAWSTHQQVAIGKLKKQLNGNGNGTLSGGGHGPPATPRSSAP